MAYRRFALRVQKESSKARVLSYAIDLSTTVSVVLLSNNHKVYHLPLKGRISAVKTKLSKALFRAAKVTGATVVPPS